MKPVLYIALALLAAALQSAVLRWAGGGAVSIAIPLALVVHLGLHARTVEGAVASAGIGYVLDLVTGGPKGLMTFLAVLLFLFTRLVGGALDVRGKLGALVLTGVGVFLYGAAALGITKVMNPAELAPGVPLLRRIAVEAGLTAAVSPVLAAILRRVDRLFVRDEAALLR